MKILMLSHDAAVAHSGLEAHDRLSGYADAVGELHVLVLTRASQPDGMSGNFFWYPVAAHSRLMQRLHAYRRARALCRMIPFDLISVQAPDEVGLLLFFVARTFGIPFHVQLHADTMSPWYRSASLRAYVRYRIARILLPRAHCIRAVSERIARSLTNPPLSIPRERISVLPLYTDIAPFQRAAPDPAMECRLAPYRWKMLAVGRFVEREKNFLLLIKMMADLARTNPDAILVLVGDGPDRERYAREIAKRDLTKQVWLEPWSANLPRLFHSFDVLLVSSYAEGWGRVVIEAMASGLPIITTDAGVAGEVVKNGEHGFIVPVHDAAALRNAVLTLRRNPDQRWIFSENAARTARDRFGESREAYLKRYQESFQICGIKS